MICRSDLATGTPRGLRLVCAVAGLILVTASPVLAHDEHEASSDQVAQLRTELRAVRERLAKLDSLMEAILDRRHRDPEARRTRGVGCPARQHPHLVHQSVEGQHHEAGAGSDDGGEDDDEPLAGQSACCGPAAQGPPQASGAEPHEDG